MPEVNHSSAPNAFNPAFEINSTFPGIPKMIDPHSVLLQNALSSMHLKKDNARLDARRDKYFAVGNGTVTIPYTKTNEFIQKPRIRTRTNPDKILLDQAKANILRAEQAEKRLINTYLAAGDIASAEYLLGRELTQQEIADKKIDNEKQKEFKAEKQQISPEEFVKMTQKVNVPNAPPLVGKFNNKLENDLINELKRRAKLRDDRLSPIHEDELASIFSPVTIQPVSVYRNQPINPGPKTPYHPKGRRPQSSDGDLRSLLQSFPTPPPQTAFHVPTSRRSSTSSIASTELAPTVLFPATSSTVAMPTGAFQAYTGPTQLSADAINKINRIRTTKTKAGKPFGWPSQIRAINEVMAAEGFDKFTPSTNEIGLTNRLRTMGYSGKGMGNKKKTSILKRR